jgi:hypothetical protein
MRARICAAFDNVFGPIWVGIMLAVYRLRDRRSVSYVRMAGIMQARDSRAG